MTRTSSAPRLVGLGLVLLLGVAGCDCGGEPPPVPPGDADAGVIPDGGQDLPDGGTVTLTSVDVTPTQPTLAQGTRVRLSATGIYSDQTKRDLTAQAAWSTSDPAIATVSSGSGSQGEVTGVAAGTATVTAVVSSVSGGTSVTVTNATLTAISVTPTNPTLARNATLAFKATGRFSDGTTQELTTQVTWSSSDPAVATVSNTAGSHGLATGIAAGTASISAAMGGVTGATTLTVTNATLSSLSVSPAAASIPKGSTQAFVATAAFSDGTTRDVTAGVTWSTAEPNIATISNTAGSEGVATALAIGTTTVTATSGSVTGTASLTVTAATLQSISVSPGTASMAKGTAQQFTAAGLYSDGSSQDLTQQVIWASSNTSIVTVSNAAGSEGLATAVNVGAAMVTASLQGVSGSAQVTVTNAALSSITVTPTNQTLAVGNTLQYSATGTYSDGTTQDLTNLVTWSSSNEAAATVSNAFGSKGLATGVGAGETTISATRNGVTGSTQLTISNATLTSIAITPATPRLPAGYRLQFTATGTYSDGSTQDITPRVTWSSSATGVATISNAAGSQGQATGVSAGTSTIRAELSGTSATTELTVTTATLTSLAITPSSFTLNAGQSRQLTATGTFSDGTTLDVTEQVNWSSSAPNVATVSNIAGSRGLVAAIRRGSATITAAKGSVNATSSVTVP